MLGLARHLRCGFHTNRRNTLRTLIAISAAAFFIGSAAIAQTTSPTPSTTMPPASPGTASPTGSSNPAVNPPGNAMVAPSALERGANSFTEGQARSRLEGAGLSNVTDLTKDDQGIWRGKAMQAWQERECGLRLQRQYCSPVGPVIEPVSANRRIQQHLGDTA